MLRLARRLAIGGAILFVVIGGLALYETAAYGVLEAGACPGGYSLTALEEGCRRPQQWLWTLFIAAGAAVGLAAVARFAKPRA